MVTPDPRLIGFLSRALSHEMSAVQQYLMQSRLAAIWELADVSEHLRQDVAEELMHAERLMERMLSYGAAANATQLASVRLGKTLEEMLHINNILEWQAVRLYQEAVSYCERVGDYENRELFASILGDEISHLKEIENQQRTLLTRE